VLVAAGAVLTLSVATPARTDPPVTSRREPTRMSRVIIMAPTSHTVADITVIGLGQACRLFASALRYSASFSSRATGTGKKHLFCLSCLLVAPGRYRA
jgi:hypothetical protein